MTEQIRHAVKNPISTDVFDFEANLATILREAGLKPQDCGGEVTFASGADPLIPGRFRFGSAAALALAAKGSPPRRSGGTEAGMTRTSTSTSGRRFAASPASPTDGGS
ncbi:hypothetical protein ACFQ0G_05030 [Streptomyces chiangmaiensis]